jgi:hypothetical protein
MELDTECRFKLTHRRQKTSYLGKEEVADELWGEKIHRMNQARL